MTGKMQDSFQVEGSIQPFHITLTSHWALGNCNPWTDYKQGQHGQFYLLSVSCKLMLEIKDLKQQLTELC